MRPIRPHWSSCQCYLSFYFSPIFQVGQISRNIDWSCAYKFRDIPIRPVFCINILVIFQLIFDDKSFGRRTTNPSVSFDHSIWQDYKKGISIYPHIRSVWGRGTYGVDVCVGWEVGGWLFGGHGSSLVDTNKKTQDKCGDMFVVWVASFIVTEFQFIYSID